MSDSGDQWLQGFIPYLLYRVTNRLNALLLGRLRALKVNPSRWRVLSVLKAHGRLSISEIVEQTLMEQPTVSRVISQLEREGRVERHPSKEDSRVTHVVLTDQGIEAFDAIAPTATRHQEIALHGLTKKELDSLVKILKKIDRNIELYG